MRHKGTKKNMRLDRGQIEVIDDISAKFLRGKTPAERIKIAFNMWDLFNEAFKAHLISIHPKWTTDRIQKEMLKKIKCIDK